MYTERFFQEDEIRKRCPEYQSVGIGLLNKLIPYKHVAQTPENINPIPQIRYAPKTIHSMSNQIARINLGRGQASIDNINRATAQVQDNLLNVIARPVGSINLVPDEEKGEELGDEGDDEEIVLERGDIMSKGEMQELGALLARDALNTEFNEYLDFETAFQESLAAPEAAAAKADITHAQALQELIPDVSLGELEAVVKEEELDVFSIEQIRNLNNAEIGDIRMALGVMDAEEFQSRKAGLEPDSSKLGGSY